MTDVVVRPVEASDEAFLRVLYTSTRDDVATAPLSGEEKTAFLDMQYRAQRADYESRFPQSVHSVIEHDGVPVGRIWIDRRPDEIRLLDVALLPDVRNRGIGARLLRGLIDEAQRAGVALRHSVYKANTGALRFYERLGFDVVEDFEIYVLMEWTGPPVTASSE